MHYYAGNDKSQEYVHQVNIDLKKNATADQIVNELIREEGAYFGPKVVESNQLKRLIQKIMDNKGKKVGKLKLKPTDSGTKHNDPSISKQSPQNIIEPKEKKKPEIPSLAGKLPEPFEKEAKADFEDIKPKGKIIKIKIGKKQDDLPKRGFDDKISKNDDEFNMGGNYIYIDS